MYCEIATNELSNRGIIEPVEAIGNYRRLAQIGSYPLYRSLYSYDEEILEHFKIRKTVAHYRGKYYAEHILLDVDFKATFEETRVAVLNLVEQAEKLGIPKSIQQIWFSGTGFHIVFQMYSTSNLPTIFLPW